MFWLVSVIFQFSLLPGMGWTAHIQWDAEACCNPPSPVAATLSLLVPKILGSDRILGGLAELAAFHLRLGELVMICTELEGSCSWKPGRDCPKQIAEVYTTHSALSEEKVQLMWYKSNSKPFQQPTIWGHFFIIPNSIPNNKPWLRMVYSSVCHI
jgi:hypothetical protein